MAYEKVKLVVAFMTGEIYMARISDKGIMDNKNRRIATDDVLNATAEWFIKNKKKSSSWEGHGKLVWIPEEKEDDE
ncbi:hypothetical protein BHU61_06620 [Macrococcus epidermidis]|uniref:Uncharacterized protein n=1 Tax=Macrococcus epidermidis TaxID=1902580 RepID=A0A327ZRP3_9STAP|nr:hypothetical protein [Macrococcus epidermidis]RAK44981.1 hypothetical protein BHU61_06620 [Macrococcus epidermidis]